MENVDTQKTINAAGIFTKHYIDARLLYFYRHNALPSVFRAYGINGEKACMAIKEKFGALIESEHEMKYLDKKIAAVAV